MHIVSRAEWGFDGWARDSRGNQKVPYAVDEKSQRTEFFVHYEGGNPVLYQTGNRVPRDIHAFHKRQGWKGIGYGHVIDAPGVIYEGRGFDMVGSHCPDHNTSGYSAQVHIGGNEHPTAAQIAAVRWLYAEACRRSGRRLAIRGHRDGFATACPGNNLYALVKSGAFSSNTAPVNTPAPEEDDMPYSKQELQDIAAAGARQAFGWGMESWRSPRDKVGRSMYGLLLQAATGTADVEVDYDKVAEAVVARMPEGADRATMKGAFVDALKELAAQEQAEAGQ